MKEKKGIDQFYYFVFGICFFLFILAISGFIAFVNRKEKVIDMEEAGGKIVLNYTNNFPGLSLEKITPMTETIAKKNLKEGEYFDFSVSTSLDNASMIEYEIALVKNTKKTTVKDSDIKVYLEYEKSGTYTSVLDSTIFSSIKKQTDLGSPVGSMVLYNKKKTKSEEDNYRLRVWLSETSLLESGNIEVEVQVYGHAK